MSVSRRAFVGASAIALGGLAMGLLCLHGGKSSAQGDGPDCIVVRDATCGGEGDHSPVAAAIAAMSVGQKAAQLLMPTPEGLLGALNVDATVSDSYGETGVTSVGDDLRRALAAYPVGGLCLFGANITGADQTRTLLADLTEATGAAGAGVPALLAVDEEGGPLVARVANSGYFDVEQFPAMADVGQAGDVSKAQHIGRAIGAYLYDLGFNLDFAPVADVLTNPDNTVIASRSFGSDSDLVASMVKAEAEGFAGTGVACCAKHFPGHGDTVGDSHTGKATSTRTRDQLDACEFVPFRAAIEADVPAIMVGHIGLPAVTGDDVPATMSSDIVDGILRRDLGYDGLVVSDSMGMAAIGNFYHSDEAAVGFIKAGGDLVLGPNDLSVAFRGLVSAMESGDISEERVDQSLNRILKVKQACGLI